MTLKEANETLESLENEENYWLNQKEILLSMVLPKATDTTVEQVDGGKVRYSTKTDENGSFKITNFLPILYS